MAEIRLICPGCAAEYRVPEAAIPAEGREVECSACGNVWHSSAQDAPARPDDEAPNQAIGDMPRLSRRLPDSVLDILRDEVEHERRARAAEEAPSHPAEAPAPPRPAADPEWPATTITRHIEARAAEPAPLLPRPVPKPQVFEMPPKSAAPEPALPLQEPAILHVPEPAAPIQPAPVQPAPKPAPAPARGSYGAGFGLAAMLAAACVVLYLLAPALSDQGAFGDALMQLRGQVDEARLWLQDRAATLTR